MESIPSDYLDLFERPSICTFATLDDDGIPHVTPVWVDYDGEFLKVVTRTETRKYHHVRRDSRVGLVIIDPDDPHRYLSIQGVVAEHTEEGALAFSDEQAARYWDVEEFPYAREAPRALLFIRPEWVHSTTIPTPSP